MKFTVLELVITAVEAFYQNGHIHLILSDKKKVSFPIELNTKLRNATEEQLHNLEIICNGTGLHWPDLDEDLSILGIMEGRFGR